MPFCWKIHKKDSTVLAEAILPHADRGRGMMFRRTLGEEQGIWMDMDCTSRFLSSIHMFFVFFPLSIFWLDRNGTVVDKVLAHPFHPFYMPRKPARFILELHASKLELADVGDTLILSIPEPN
jgi:hypothetical protein